MAKRLPIVAGRPFMTYAKADEFAGQPAYGLKELLDATFRVAPEGVHGALVAAQEIDQVAESARGEQVHNRCRCECCRCCRNPDPLLTPPCWCRFSLA